jgi:hypothetical protein
MLNTGFRLENFNLAWVGAIWGSVPRKSGQSEMRFPGWYTAPVEISILIKNIIVIAGRTGWKYPRQRTRKWLLLFGW